MKAIILEGKQEVKVVERPMPRAEDGYVVVKVIYVGICASDKGFWMKGAIGQSTKKIVLGHEIIGTIADAGNSEFQVGERVTAIEYEYCGECRQCKTGHPNLCDMANTDVFGVSKDGGFAEYLAIRAQNVYRVPDSISDVQAAMIEPASVAMHGLTSARVMQGSKVLITGAGSIGLMAAALAKALGASYVATTARSDSKLEFARNCDFIDGVFDGKDENLRGNLLEGSGGGFDSLIECSGGLLALGISVLVRGGSAAVVGYDATREHAFPQADVMANEKHVHGCIYFTPEEFQQVIDLMASGKVNIEPVATSIIGFDEVQDRLRAMADGASQDLKVIIDPAL